MSGLRISSEDVLATSSQMKQLNQQVQDLFAQVNQRMNQMNAVWDSPASQSLISQFQSLRPIFDSYVQALNEYAQFLHRTALSYQENEQMLSSGLK